jgi:membrane protein DedA with SNARE-associated domain
VSLIAGWFSAGPGVGDPATLLAHWGYVAVFVLVILGNAGVPVPEETVLLLAGYLVWRGELELHIVLAVGFAAAVTGDNIGYWLGRRFGKGALERHAHWILGHPERLESMQRFVARRGALAVFVAHFVPGLRFTAGPLAGALGLDAWSFTGANVLGAAFYVPLTVAGGWAIGYGLGGYVERLRRVVGNVEHFVLLAAVASAGALIAWRAARWLSRRPKAS